MPGPTQEKLVAVVLVGGEGTRLRPLTEDTPKPMLPLLGRPLLAYTLDALIAAGVQRAILSCGYLPVEIEGYFGDSYRGLALEYRVEPEPLGTGGAIRFSAAGLERTFLALNGDTLREASLGPLLAAHRSKNAEATILLVRVADPSRYGLVRVDGGGRVRGFVEKPQPLQIDTNLVNAGLYVIEPAVLDLIEPGRPVSIEREVFPALVERGTLFGLELPGYWLDVGTPESYLQGHHDLLAQRGTVEVASDANVSPEADLVGPLLVGEGVVVEAGAQVGPYTYVAAGARIGADARVERAVVLPGGVVKSGHHVCTAIVSADALVASA
jgi:mannose-1-phosphate guanylyltransferase